MPFNIPPQNIAETGTQQPTAMQNISGMLNMQSQGNQVQLGKQAIQSNDMNLQSQTQANQERINLQGFMSQPDNWQTNGKIDMQKLNAAVPKIAPQTGGAVLQQMGTLSQSQTQADQAQQNMTQSQRAIIAGPIGVLGRAGVQDPQAYANEIDNLVQQNPDNKSLSSLAQAYKTQLAHIPPGQHVADGAIKMSQGLLDPTQQQASLSPTASLTNTGGQLTPVINTPSVAGNAPSIAPAGTSSIPLTLSPGAQQSVSNDSNGNPITISRDRFGNVQGITGTPVQGQGVTAPNIIPQGESAQSMNDLRQARTATNTAAAQVPNSHTYNQNVIRLTSDPDMLNPNAWAGKGAAYLSKLGLPAGTDYKTALDQVSHNLAMSTQANEQAMGVHTDAGAQTTALATGSIGMTPAALASAAKMNDATASGLDAFNRGQEAAISANGGNVAARRAFQNAWSSAYSPTVMALHNAISSGNQTDVQNIIQQVGGPKSPGAIDLANRAKAIQSLVQTGKLPQGSQ